MTLPHIRILALEMNVSRPGGIPMRKRTESTHKAKRTITMPDEIDLSTYNSLDVTFTNGKGNELFNIQFRRESDRSIELVFNIIGPAGEVSSAITFFDLNI